MSFNSTTNVISRRAIFRVPPEIYGEIFSYMVPGQSLDDWPEAHSVYADWGAPRRLMSVCSLWFRVVRATPSLWTYAEPWKMDPEGVNEMLNRSANLSLNVPMALRDGPLTWIPNIMAERSTRIKRLRLDVFIDDTTTLNTILATLKTFFTPSAPRVKWADIQFYMSDNIPPSSQSTLRLPTMFGGSLPALRRLFLNGVAGWLTGGFTGLTHLCVERWPSEDPVDSFWCILGLLQENPRLQTLELAVLLTTGGPEEQDDTIHSLVLLYDLKVLLIEDVDFAVHLLLRHLIIPQAALVKLISVSSDDPTQRITIASELPHDLSNLQPFTSVECGVITIPEDSQITFKGMRADGSLATRFEKKHFMVNDPEGPSLSLVLHPTLARQLTRLTVMLLEDLMFLSDEWLELFHALPLLSGLNFGFTAAPFDALTWSGYSKPCSNLRSIHLQMPLVGIFTEAFASLAACATSRHKHAVPFKVIFQPASIYPCDPEDGWERLAFDLRPVITGIYGKMEQ